MATSFVSAASTRMSAKVREDRSTTAARFGCWTRAREGNMAVAMVSCGKLQERLVTQIPRKRSRFRPAATVAAE